MLICCFGFYLGLLCVLGLVLWLCFVVCMFVGLWCFVGVCLFGLCECWFWFWLRLRWFWVCGYGGLVGCSLVFFDVLRTLVVCVYCICFGLRV